VAKPSADLVPQIVELQAEFQRVADKHSWICLAIPPLGSDRDSVAAGELITLSALARRLELTEEQTATILDQYGRPLDSGARTAQRWGEWDRMLDHYGPLGPPWVIPPENSRLRAITDHVNSLTDEANRLLLRVLRQPNQIPSDLQHEIEKWNENGRRYGWVRWLWHSAVMCHTQWCENYPQVAATALRALKEHCRLDGSVYDRTRRSKKGRGGRRPLESRDPVKFQIYDRIRQEHDGGAKPRDIQDRLKHDKYFMEQIEQARLKLSKPLVKRALAFFDWRKRQESPPA
jgi:hypothetical protein